MYQSGAHIAERMPVARMLSWVEKAASSMTLEMRRASFFSSTRRTMDRLRRTIRSPCRLREALITGWAGWPSRSMMAARSAGTASKSRSSTFSNSSASGRWTMSCLAASLSTPSTRF